MRRRAAAGKRWAAASSVIRWDAAGRRLTDDRARAARVKVRWRLDGASRSATFSGPGCEAAAEEFRALLLAAYAGDWPADADHRPVAPRPLPSAADHTTPGDTTPDDTAPDDPGLHGTAPAPVRVAPQPLPLPAPPAGGAVAGAVVSVAPVAVADVEALAARRLARHRRGPKRRGGGGRSPTTTGNYASSLRFITEHLRYQPGDPRLDALGVEAGTSMRLDDPVTGVGPADRAPGTSSPQRHRHLPPAPPLRHRTNHEPLPGSHPLGVLRSPAGTGPLNVLPSCRNAPRPDTA